VFDKVRTWLADVPAKAKVLLGAWPAWAAAATATLGAFGDELVPLLPDHWAVQIGGAVAVVLAAIGVVSAAVARVTPILYPEQKGLLPPEGYEPEPQAAEWSGDVQVYPDPEQRSTTRSWRRPGTW
jgi:hypothetical protein